MAFPKPVFGSMLLVLLKIHQTESRETVVSLHPAGRAPVLACGLDIGNQPLGHRVQLCFPCPWILVTLRMVSVLHQAKCLEKKHKHAANCLMFSASQCNIFVAVPLMMEVKLS